jgi:hypothetical protein
MRCSSIVARSFEHSIQSTLVLGLLQSVSAGHEIAYPPASSAASTHLPYRIAAHLMTHSQQ